MPFYDREEDIERAELYRLFSAVFMEEPSDELIFQFKDIFQMKFEEMPEEIRVDFMSLFSMRGGQVNIQAPFFTKRLQIF